MRIILDTNIFIYREQLGILDPEIASLMELISTRSIHCLKHPISVEEIQGCNNDVIKAMNLSKLDAYPSLTNYPDPYQNNDTEYLDVVDAKRNCKDNDRNDNIILYAVYKDAVDVLVTNDNKLVNKAQRFTPELNVYTVSEALYFLNTLYPASKTVTTPLGITETEMYNVDLGDPLFDTLKKDYGEEFSEWYKDKSREGRMCYVYYQPGTQKLGCFMSCKEEDEPVECVKQMN